MMSLFGSMDILMNQLFVSLPERLIEILELSLEDLDAEGEAAYDKKVLHNVDKVTKDRPLLVKLTFYGAIPHWGISYKDADGKRKTCLLTVSGKDGSLLLEDL